MNHIEITFWSYVKKGTEDECWEWQGENSPVARLTNQEGEVIYVTYWDGQMNQVDLAAKFKVSQQSISQIVRAEGRWIWLKDES